jgi:hypothetical protein
VAFVLGGLLADDGVVFLDDGVGLRVAQALGRGGEALHVGEHERHAAVGRCVSAEVGAVVSDGSRDGVDRVLRVAHVRALRLELQGERLLEHHLHVELARGIEAPVQEVERLVPVFGLVALEQHLRVLELGARHERRRSHARVHGDRVLEAALGVLPARERPGEESQPTRHRPTAGRGTYHHRIGGRRQQEVVDDRRPARVAKVVADLGDLGDADQPGRIDREAGEVVLREDLVLGARLVLPTQLGVDRREASSVGRDEREVLDEALVEPLQLGRSPLITPHP